MLKKKSLHRDMADVNVYTARRLKDMAMSLSGLAQAFADEIGGGRQLTKGDGSHADCGGSGLRRLCEMQSVLRQQKRGQLLSLLSSPRI